MRCIGHIILGWVAGLMTGYLLDPSAGFFVAVLVGFLVGILTTLGALHFGTENELHDTNHTDHS